VLEPGEIGRHDEILQSLVAHNARRRAQRHRSARNRHFARLASRLAVPLAFGVGVYFVVVLMSGLLGLGKSSDGGHTAAAATPPAASAPASNSGASPFGGGLSLPAATPKPSTAKHVAAPKAKAIAHRSVRAPVTASIASVPAAHHHAAAKKAQATPKQHATSPSQQQVVLAEADAAKGTKTTALEATIPDPHVATLTISAARGPAFVELRLKSRTGPLLTKGIIPQGESITFTGKLMWVDAQTLENLDLTVNGRSWRPSGSSVVATLTPTGAHR
jgi:hypothetical protein